jgi:hypothetical protein
MHFFILGAFFEITGAARTNSTMVFIILLDIMQYKFGCWIGETWNSEIAMAVLQLTVSMGDGLATM